MNKKDMDRNLKYSRNEKRINDTYNKGEDTTKYGEFVPSEFAWISPEKQKEKAREIESITEKKSNKVKYGDNNKDNYKKKE